ncbi:tetratricopeptide repeat protein [Bradyrhizobium sp. HKCCYLS1011]|uniref:tetratricopeptide repeat protein n=1 Tax=Bradyrhizobium sp. HKCCYLS1011 TaxID=3420733 RepID=UPI003EB6AC06
MVVDQTSASSLCNKPPLLAVETDHIGIAKPADRHAVQYQAFATAFRNEATSNKLMLVNRGYAYLSDKQWDQALKYFDEATRIDPDYVSALKNRGAVYLERQDWERAIKDYDRAIQLEPCYAEHFCNRGVAYFGRLDYNQAIADFTTAIHLDFYDKPFALYVRGRAKQRQGDLAGAEADMAEARRIDPKVDQRAVW